MPRYIPTERCDKPERHKAHPWDKGPFKRRCPGRSTSRKGYSSGNGN